MHLNKLLRKEFHFILLELHKIVCDSFCLIHFCFRHFSWVLLLEQSWKWVTDLWLKWVWALIFGFHLWIRCGWTVWHSGFLSSVSLLAKENTYSLSNMRRWCCVKDAAVVQITSPDVCWGFKVRPDTSVAPPLTAPSPSFQMDVVGWRWRNKPDTAFMETHAKTSTGFTRS